MKTFMTLTIASFLLVGTTNAHANQSNDFGHIHSIKVQGEKVLLGTHEGLFQALNSRDMKRIGNQTFDVMGLEVEGSTLYASGHPGMNFAFPNPVGLLVSTDSGKNWRAKSLQRKVDFHFLEAQGKEIVGVNAADGAILYSRNSGTSWARLENLTFTDFAFLPGLEGEALFLDKNELFRATQQLKKYEKLSSKLKFSQLLSLDSGEVYATSGNSLYRSANQGKNWVLVYEFDNPIIALEGSPKLLCVLVGETIFVSKNGGKAFSQLGKSR